MLTNQSLTADRDFKLEISCDENEFVVNLNETWEEKLAYNASVLDHIVEIGVSGAITVYKAGYTGEVITCLTHYSVPLILYSLHYCLKSLGSK